MEKKIRAFRLQEGDTVLVSEKHNITGVVKSVVSGNESIKVQYTNGGIGIYPHRNTIKIIL